MKVNIINLLPSYYIEHQFFGEIFEKLDKEVFDGLTLYATRDYQTLPSYGKDVVVLLTAGDEKGGLPAYHNDVLCVFKHHLDSDRVGNVYHLPLPYVNGFSGYPGIQIRKRRTDVLFAGRSSRREDMLLAVEKLQDKRKDLRIVCYVTGTKFMKGWPISTYSTEMSNAKIVLSPQGAVRAECIRFTEAVKCGAAIIACKHPDLSCFSAVPAEYLDGWQGLEQAVERLLAPGRLERVYKDTLIAWDSFFSPAAQAEQMNFLVEYHRKTNGNQ